MRQLRLIAAVAVLASSAAAVRLATPSCVAACSCVEPRPLQAYLTEPNVVLLAGTVVQMAADPQLGGGGRRGTLAVQRVFKGTVNAAQIPIADSDGAACGIGVSAGQSLVFVGYVDAGVIRPSLCSPHADLASAEGQALLAEAQAIFGPGSSPPSAAPNAAPTGDSVLATAGWAILIAAAIAVPILLVVVYLARRGSADDADPDPGIRP